MTKRLQYPNFWAESGTATDPDLDTTHPSYEANRYETKGWHAEKPPEKWQNFLTQITDKKVISRIIGGIDGYDASVTYPDGALYSNAGKIYKMVGGAAKEVLSPQRLIYENLVKDAKALYDAHLLADNPHQDTVDTLVDKSYIKEDVDKFFGSETDPKTIVYHKLRTGAVHSETPAQVGTLPTSGGAFTGDVAFIEEAVIQLTPSKYIHYNKATAIMEIVNGTYAMGTDAAGNGYITGSSGSVLIVTAGNLDLVTMRNNYKFALPACLFDMNIESSFCDAGSTGSWAISVQNTPVFEYGKGYALQSTNTLSGGDIPTEHTVVVRGFNGTDGVVTVTDSNAAATYLDLSDFVPASITHIKQVTIFPKLTAFQKSTLVNK